MKKIALLMALVLTVSMFAACGGSSGVDGTYELVSMKEGDTTYDVDQLKSMAEMMGVKGALITMELTSDGKANIASSFMEEVAGEGTYTLDGDKITVTIQDAPVSGTVDGKTITLAQDDMEMVFEKQ